MKKHKNWEVRNPKTKKCKESVQETYRRRWRIEEEKTFVRPLSKREKSQNKETIRLENTEKSRTKKPYKA